MSRPPSGDLMNSLIVYIILLFIDTVNNLEKPVKIGYSSAYGISNPPLLQIRPDRQS